LSTTNIGIIGVGGVGGYFGGKLCQLLKNSHDFDISFVARGDHLRAIQKSGLLLASESDGTMLCRPSVATNDFEKLPPLNLCLICVKQFDLPAVLGQLKPLIGSQTTVIPLLNGVDVYSRVRQVVTDGVVLPACVYVGTHIERPGKVVQNGGACKILFGPDPLRPAFRAGDIVGIFERANIKCEWTLNIQAEIWQKFIFICAYGLVGAAHNSTLGQILENTALRSDARAVIMEATSVAKASGVTLPPGITETSLAKARNFPYEARTSFQRDFERPDKSDDRDLFAGAMIRMAKELALEIPKTTELAAALEKRKPAVRSST